MYNSLSLYQSIGYLLHSKKKVTKKKNQEDTQHYRYYKGVKSADLGRGGPAFAHDHKSEITNIYLFH